MSAKQRGPTSVIADLHQAGSLKALFPRSRSAALDAVFLNTAGGMTGGDDFEISAAAGPDSRLTLTSQAAERIYGAVDTTDARLATRLSLAKGSRIDWLPQETIFFNMGRLRRTLDVDMAVDAQFLMVEPLVFGRRTMGECVVQGALCDDVRVRRGDDLVFADAIRLQGDMQNALQGIATANKKTAMASLLYVAPDAQAHLAPLQALMPLSGGVSLIRDGVLFARLLADDSFLLRQALCPMMVQLQGGALPKTWML